MSRSAARARSGQDRTSLYQEITDKIIAELEAARAPWVQPWGTAAAKAALAMPRNASTHRRYSGINVLILWGAVIERGFSSQSWLTFRQALGLGGNVRKGERGTTVVYADRFTPEDERRRAAETGEEAQAIPFLKRFTVFNTAQCEGLPDEMMVVAPPVETGLVLPQAEALIRATGIDFRIGGARAFYSPAHDFVHVPPPQAYFEPINFARQRSRPQAESRSLRFLRLESLCARRVDRRNGGRLRMRVTRHRADRAPRGLPRFLVGGASR
jgi:antirestriction protein ArdC